jgi:hypothetical protein
MVSSRYRQEIMINTNPQILTAFNGHVIQVVQHSNDVWLTAEQIGESLEYKETNKSILEIYRRHQDELAEYSVILKLRASDGKQYDTRVFNEKGVMLITMFSKQPKAAEFRRWAIDILSHYRAGRLAPVQQTLPLTPIEPPKPLPSTVVVDQSEYIELLKTKITFLEQQNRAPVRVNFTLEERAMVRQWHAQGISLSNIATRLGRTTDAIRGLITRMKQQGGE